MPYDNSKPYVFPDLTYLFAPRSIAVVGASDKTHSIGNHAMLNIVKHSKFSGKVYPVNPKQAEVMGLKAYPDVQSLPEAVDVVMVVVPSKAVRATVEQAGEKGCGFAVILSSGFSEADEWGKAEELRLVEISERTGLRIYGPNCPGLVNLNLPLGMTFSPAFKDDLTSGAIGLATQGGGLGRNLIQNNTRGASFGLWSSSGNECDLQVADFIHHMAHDPEIKVIGCLVEGFKDGPRFAAACAEAARMKKPVVGLKVGHSDYGAKAAASHTAAITGSAEVNSTVFRELGVVEVDDLDEMVDIAALFTRHMPSGDEELAVFASSGGAASLCADNVGIAKLKLAEFTQKTMARLAEALPAYAGMSNPIDTTSISISHPEAYRDALLACAQDENVGLVLAPVPMDYGDYSAVNAKAMAEVQKQVSISIVPVWMSERQGKGYAAFAEAGLVPIRSLRNMRKAVRRWIDYGAWLKNRDADWQPAIMHAGSQPGGDVIRDLTEFEGKQRLQNSGIAVTVPYVAASAAEAGKLAEKIGGKIAMKIVSADIQHKSDIGGVKLNVSAAQAAAAFNEIMENARQAVPNAKLDGVLLEQMAPEGGLEVFVGVACDPVFGHVMTFGLGGIYVEMFADVTRSMLPIPRKRALAMIGELKSSRLLTGYRGRPKRDVEALADLIVQVSDFVRANPNIVELDINPVWVGDKGSGVLALDAVIRVAE